MSQAKKKKRKAAAREASSSDTQRGPMSGWTGPIIVLVLGLGVIGWQAGFFGDDPSPEEPAASGGNGVVDRTDIKPQIITESAEVTLAGQRSWDEIDDAATDGWDSEALHQKIKKQLDRLGRVLVSPKQATSDVLAPLLAAEFRSTPLRPATLTAVLQEKGLTVERGTFPRGDVAGTGDNSDVVQDAEGLARAIRELTGNLEDAQRTRYEFKVVRVDVKEGVAETEQLLTVSGLTSEGTLEQHATWITEWTDLAGDPKLRSIDVTRFEQSRTGTESPSLFVDCTDSALRNTPSYESQILRGANHWFQQIPYRNMLNLFSMPGIAVGDVNGDGLEDLYLCQDPGIPNRLYLQNKDGTAREVSKQWGVDWLEDARSALLIDLDNDGDQDLVVAIQRHVVVAENQDNARFRVQAALTTSEDLTSLCAFDYDADGRLDIYACAYHVDQFLKESTGDTIGATRQQFVLHDANDAAANSMFRNTIEPGQRWEFEDVTESSGLDENNRRWSFAASAEDYDNDGDLDLYVANDYGRDNLYRNDVGDDGQRRFVDVGEEAKIEDSAAGMAVSWSDYNRDGWMDAYVSNMWSSAGHRITTQPDFKPDASKEVLDRFRHFAAGNTLLKNRGDGTFLNRSAADNVSMGRWAWGNAFLDVNNDGWDDLVVANGYMTTEDSGDL